MRPRRQTFAEGAVLGLYRALADAPSPLPALRGAEAELKQLSAAAAEAAKLKRELAENDREFEGLKSQEQSIKRLEKELREAEARADAAVEDAVRARRPALAGPCADGRSGAGCRTTRSSSSTGWTGRTGAA